MYDPNPQASLSKYQSDHSAIGRKNLKMSTMPANPNNAYRTNYKAQKSFSPEQIKEKAAALNGSEFWGTLTLHFQGGKVVLMSLNETIKPSDKSSGARKQKSHSHKLLA